MSLKRYAAKRDENEKDNLNMENLIQEINESKYILINDIAKWEYDLEIKKEKCRKLGGIFQGVHDIQTDWFGDTKQIKFSILLPIEKAKEW